MSSTRLRFVPMKPGLITRAADSRQSIGTEPICHKGKAVTRRQFLLSTSLAITGTGLLSGCEGLRNAAAAQTIIDIHQHVGYNGRPNDVLLDHQRAMGVTQTILL